MSYIRHHSANPTTYSWVVCCIEKHTFWKRTMEQVKLFSHRCADSLKSVLERIENSVDMNLYFPTNHLKISNFWLFVSNNMKWRTFLLLILCEAIGAIGMLMKTSLTFYNYLIRDVYCYKTRSNTILNYLNIERIDYYDFIIKPQFKIWRGWSLILPCITHFNTINVESLNNLSFTLAILLNDCIDLTSFDHQVSSSIRRNIVSSYKDVALIAHFEGAYLSHISVISLIGVYFIGYVAYLYLKSVYPRQLSLIRIPKETLIVLVRRF